MHPYLSFALCLVTFLSVFLSVCQSVCFCTTWLRLSQQWLQNHFKFFNEKEQLNKRVTDDDDEKENV